MRKILVADDAKLSRMLTHRILEKGSYEMVEASNGKEALGILENTKIDCIMLDLHMPDISGLEVLETLKENGINIPVLVLTADVQATTSKKCIDKGAAGVLAKPVSEEILLNTLNEIFNKET